MAKWGMHGEGGRTWERGTYGIEGTHGFRGRGQERGRHDMVGMHGMIGTYMHAPNDGLWSHAMWLVWDTYVSTHNWRHEKGSHDSKEEGIYVLSSSFEVASLLVLAPCLAPAKCFAWALEAIGLGPSYLGEEVFAKKILILEIYL
jgi:hypothetical protein